MCNLRYGVRGFEPVALPCGHTLGACRCCSGNNECKTTRGQKQRKIRFGTCSSLELECPYCGISIIGQGHLGKQNYDTVAALHAAEMQLTPERKLELQRQLRLASPEAEAEGGQDDLEMDFNDIIEYGT